MELTDEQIVFLENLVLFISSVWCLGIGGLLYPPSRVSTVLKRISIGLLAAAILTVSSLQYGRYSNGDTIEPWKLGISLGIGAVTFILAFILPILGIIISSIYICTMISVMLLSVVIIQSTEDTYLFVEAVSLGLTGLLVLLYLKFKRLFGSLITLYASGLLFFTAASCYARVPVIQLLYLLTDEDDHNCSIANNFDEETLFLTLGAIAAGMGFLVQLFTLFILKVCQKFAKDVKKNSVLLYSEFVSRIYSLYNSGQRDIIESDDIEEHKIRLKQRLKEKDLKIDNESPNQFLPFSKKFRQKEKDIRKKVEYWLKENYNFRPPEFSSPFPGERGKKISIRSLMRYDNWDDFVEGVGNGRRPGNYFTCTC